MLSPGSECRDAVPPAAMIKVLRSIIAMTFGLGYKSATVNRHDIKQAARRKQDCLDADLTTYVYYGIVTVLVASLSSY